MAKKQPKKTPRLGGGMATLKRRKAGPMRDRRRQQREVVIDREIDALIRSREAGGGDND